MATIKKIALVLTIVTILMLIIRVWVNVGKCFQVIWTGSDALGETLIILMALGIGWIIKGLLE
jgi:hypothetical protein